MTVIPWNDAPPLVQTVYHEAGHSVIAYAVRLPIREIRVGREPRERTSLDEFTGGATHRLGVVEFVGEPPPSQNPADRQRRAISRSLQLVAGPLAVGVLLGVPRNWHGADEIVATMALLDEAFSPEESATQFWGIVMSVQAILENSPGQLALQRLASRLFADRRVSGRDADRIIGTAWEEGRAQLQESAEAEADARRYWPYCDPGEHGFAVGAASELQRLDSAVEAARAYACGRTTN